MMLHTSPSLKMYAFVRRKYSLSEVIRSGLSNGSALTSKKKRPMWLNDCVSNDTALLAAHSLAVGHEYKSGTGT